MKIQKNTHGFTLVEIMIVVAIIGLLAAIAVPNFVQARTTAKKNTCINNLRIISAAKDQAALDNNLAETSVLTSVSISAYLKNNVLPTEPNGGGYNAGIGAVSVNPVCSIGGAHVLP